MSRNAGPNLLDDNRVSGLVDAQVRLRPLRPLRLLPEGSTAVFRDEVQVASETWGGGGHPMLTIASDRLSDRLLRQIERAEVDSVGGLVRPDLSTIPRRMPFGSPRGFPIAAVLGGEDRAKAATVVVPVLADGDPWRDIYAATFGYWPEVVSSRVGDFWKVREGLTYDEVVPTRREMVTGSLVDLIERQQARSLYPREVSLVRLASGSGLATGLMGRSDVLPDPTYVRRAAGPNIVVLCSPGSVADLTLLWTLRAAHGHDFDFPMGIPTDVDPAGTLRAAADDAQRAHFGFAGGHLYVTSHSMSQAEVVAVVKACGRGGIEVAPVEDVLDFGPAPGRWSQRVLTFDAGFTRLDPATEDDRDLLRNISVFFRKPGLRLDIELVDQALPRDATLRGSDFGRHFPAGRAQLKLDGDLALTSAEWPSGWTVVRALAQSRGLEASVSDAGRAAVALADAIDGLSGVSWLQNRKLLDFMRQMSESSGASVTRRRLAQYLESRDLAEDAISEHKLVTAPSGEGRAAAFADFARILTSEGAKRWLRWAEAHRLVVRGTIVPCARCGAKEWHPIGALSEAIICPGCARHIENPYHMERLDFWYKLGEVVRRAFEKDAVAHLLSILFISQILDGRGVVGGHPGVDTKPKGEGNRIGETDILIALPDGEVVVGEVKERPRGFTHYEINRLDELATAWASPWTVLATPTPGREAAVLKELERPSSSGKRRIVLTGDHLFDRRAVWVLGRDPFGWSEMSESDEAERHDDFIRSLENLTVTGPAWLDTTDAMLEEPYDSVRDFYVHSFDWQRSEDSGPLPSTATSGEIS